MVLLIPHKVLVLKYYYYTNVDNSFSPRSRDGDKVAALYITK